METSSGEGPVIVADVGGTHVSTAVVDPQLRVEGEKRFPLNADASAEVLLDRLAEAVRSQGLSSERIVLAMPGPFDYLRGIGDFRGVSKFGALRGVDLRVELSARWQCSPESVLFVNDAEAFGVGEWAAGATKGTGRSVAFTLGTGIGSAFIDNGRRVNSGSQVPPGGEIHRVDVDGTPLEELVSRRALIRAYSESTGRDLDVVDIAARARAGEWEAVETLNAGMSVLGQVVAPWLSRFSAERVVIGGAMVASSDLVFPPLRQELATLMSTPPELIAGALPGQQASLVGAAVASQGTN